MRVLTPSTLVFTVGLYLAAAWPSHTGFAGHVRAAGHPRIRQFTDSAGLSTTVSSSFNQTSAPTQSSFPATQSSVPASSSGLLATQPSLSATQSSLPATPSGLPATQSSVPATPSNLPGTSSGLPSTASRLLATQSSLSFGQSGLPFNQSSSPVTRFSSPVTQPNSRITPSGSGINSSNATNPVVCPSDAAHYPAFVLPSANANQACDIYGPLCQTGSITVGVNVSNTVTTTTTACSCYLTAQKLTATTCAWCSPSFGRSPQCTSFAKMRASPTAAVGAPIFSNCPNDRLTGISALGSADHLLPALPNVGGADGNNTRDACCGQCFASIPQVRVAYFPTSPNVTCQRQDAPPVPSITPAPHPSQVQKRLYPSYNVSVDVSDGFTFTAPSIYLELVQGIQITDYCGVVGSKLANPTVALPPGALSTISYDIPLGSKLKDFAGAAQHTKALDLKDLACPTWGLSGPWNMNTSAEPMLGPGSAALVVPVNGPVVNGGVVAQELGPPDNIIIGPPFYPIIVLPPEILNLDPAWKKCIGNLGNAAVPVFDPPRTLHAASTMAAPAPQVIPQAELNSVNVPPPTNPSTNPPPPVAPAPVAPAPVAPAPVAPAPVNPPTPANSPADPNQSLTGLAAQLQQAVAVPTPNSPAVIPPPANVPANAPVVNPPATNNAPVNPPPPANVGANAPIINPPPANNPPANNPPANLPANPPPVNPPTANQIANALAVNPPPANNAPASPPVNAAVVNPPAANLPVGNPAAPNQPANAVAANPPPANLPADPAAANAAPANPAAANPPAANLPVANSAANPVNPPLVNPPAANAAVVDPAAGNQPASNSANSPLVNVPAGNAPAGNAPAGNAPAGNAPAGNAPAGFVPTGNAPTGNAPASNVPAGFVPAGNAPGGSAPAGYVPVGSAPGGNGPAGFVPAGNVPAGFVPAGNAPGGSAPAGFVPVGSTPGGNGPAGYAPAGNVLSGYIPAGNAPGGSAPAGYVPVGSAPGGNGPAGFVPAGNAPAGYVPASNAAAVGGADKASAPVVTVNGATYTPNSASQYIIAGQTLAPNNPITVSGTPISILPGATAVAVGSEVQSQGPNKFPSDPSNANSPAAAPALVFQGLSYHPNPSSVYVIGSQTLTPGAQITVSNTPIALATDGSLAVIGSSTQVLSAPTGSANPVLSFDGSTYQRGPSSGYVIGSQTLTPGARVTISNTPISLATDGSIAVIGSSTQILSAQAPSTDPVLSLGGSTYLRGPSSEFVIASQTLTPGDQITVSNTPISLASNGKSAVIGSSTEILNAPLTTSDVFTVGGQTFTANPSSFQLDGVTMTPGAVVTIANTPISLGPSGTLEIGSSIATLGRGGGLPTATAGNSPFQGDGATVRVWRLGLIITSLGAVVLHVL